MVRGEEFWEAQRYMYLFPNNKQMHGHELGIEVHLQCEQFSLTFVLGKILCTGKDARITHLWETNWKYGNMESFLSTLTSWKT